MRRPSLLASLAGQLEQSKTASLDEVKVFRAVLSALLLTILLAGVLWFNLLLLGDFFFVYFISFVTSVSLRQSKHSAAAALEHAVQTPFSLLASSLLVMASLELWQFSFQTVSDKVNRVIDDRRLSKKTMFNDGKTVLALLFVYVGLTRLGTPTFGQVLGLLCLLEFAVKLAAALALWLLKSTGLTHLLVLDAQSKLLSCHHNLIASALCLGYFLICGATVIVIAGLVALDLNRLRTHTLGLLPWDKAKALLDPSILDSDYARLL